MADEQPTSTVFQMISWFEHTEAQYMIDLIRLSDNTLEKCMFKNSLFGRSAWISAQEGHVLFLC